MIFRGRSTAFVFFLRTKVSLGSLAVVGLAFLVAIATVHTNLLGLGLHVTEVTPADPMGHTKLKHVPADLTLISDPAVKPSRTRFAPTHRQHMRSAKDCRACRMRSDRRAHSSFHQRETRPYRTRWPYNASPCNGKYQCSRPCQEKSTRDFHPYRSCTGNRSR